ncbi:MAG: hypothetical protein ACI8XO_004167 [Verrucomicrobiales bacterium]
MFLEVDFPNGKQLPAELKAQNAKLAKDFAIQAYPTLMLCDAKGRPYAEAGFPEEMNPESMSKLLEEQKKFKATRDDAFAKAEKAEGAEKAKLLIEALGTVPEATVPSLYGETIDQIAKLDPEDKTGFVKKAKTQQAMGELESGFGKLMEADKTDEAVKYIDDFLAKHKPEGEPKQKAMMLKMFGFASAEKFEDAIKVADEIIKIDGGSETGNMVKQIKKQLEQQ